MISIVYLGSNHPLSLLYRPNLITLIGLGCMFAALAVALIFVPDLIGPGPAWIYSLYHLYLIVDIYP